MWSGWRFVELDADHARNATKISVAGQERRLLAPGDGGDHAVDQPPRGDAGLPAAAVDTGCAVEVGGRIKAVQMEPEQKTAKINLPCVAARPGQDLHDDGLSDGDRAFGRDQLGQAKIGRAPGGPVVFDPGGRVGEDHAASGGRVSPGGSPMACAPRIANASSRVIGCPARYRRARSTASVL